VTQFAEDGGSAFGLAGGLTGRSLVLFDQDAVERGVAALGTATGMSIFTAIGTGEELAGAQAVLFERLGVAVIAAPPEQLRRAGDGDAILAIEPERTVFALGVPTSDRPPAAGTSAVDESQATWGVQAVRALESRFSGRGIGVAVLDTGFDDAHPDFAGREVTMRSFVAGEDAHDAHGHGTHCIGTAAGPKRPPTGPRYGVAPEARIHAGKVLASAGSGSDAQILAGIDWAVANSCAVISMSLGAPTRPGQVYSQVFEQAARRALEAGALLVAAAGNESKRPAPPAPVGHPANCPSILAVAALDVNLEIAPFSNRGLDPDGGQVDVAGPGVDVLSSWPMPTRYRTISGTSMAAPHAAGVAALLAEANPRSRGAALGMLLTGTARRLANLPSADVGAGLVQAP
jgi:subtilisin family serine protease